MSPIQVHDSLVRHFSGSAAFRSRALETQIGDLKMDIHAQEDEADISTFHYSSQAVAYSPGLPVSSRVSSL